MPQQGPGTKLVMKGLKRAFPKIAEQREQEEQEEREDQESRKRDHVSHNTNENTLDTDLRSAQMLEVGEVTLNLKAALGQKVFEGDLQFTQTHTVREVTVNLETKLGREVFGRETQITQKLEVEEVTSNSRTTNHHRLLYRDLQSDLMLRTVETEEVKTIRDIVLVCPNIALMNRYTQVWRRSFREENLAQRQYSQPQRDDRPEEGETKLLSISRKSTKRGLVIQPAILDNLR
ncbi:MAG: hypothetical protein ASARMPRED_003165 [Alectoria sarmentosa]|nr:MAG: hypothetical protein ASARMPRED_003165 [Alectoria sarmentosa]